jgi:hypothetical protein
MYRQVCKKGRRLVRLILLASGLFLIISAGCHEYPSGASVAIQIKGVSRQLRPVMEFESWLMERMKTFSDAKIEIESTAAMPEEEQVGQLFSVLKGVVSDEAGFLSLKK